MVSTALVSGSLQNQLRQEFCQFSAIAPSLFEAAVAVVPDIELDPVTHEVLGTPIADALGWRYSRFGLQARVSQTAALFLQETGEVWQAKVFGGDSGKRSGSYLAPTGIGNRVYLPPVDAETRAAVGAPAEGNFWDWVEANTAVPLALVEGGKKSLSVLSAGTVAIALYGCDCGNSPDLERFLVPGRPVITAFDQDSQPRTKARVAKGIARLARRAVAAGCQVRIAQWQPGLGKGPDDVIATHGARIWQSIQTEALPFTVWQHQRTQQAIAYALSHPTGSYAVNLVEMLPDLQDLDVSAIPTTGTVALLSGKGTGKSKLIRRLTQDCQRLLSLGYRESLQRATADAWNLTYLRDGDRVQGRILNVDGLPCYRLSLCVDSLLAVPVADYPAGTYDVVLDEADAVLRHIINGRTCAQGGKRSLLIERFERFIQGARRVILASADLTTAELDYIAAVRNETPWVFHNRHQPESYCCLFATGMAKVRGSQKQAMGFTLSELVRVLRAAADGQARVIVATDTLANCKTIAVLAELLRLDPCSILRFDSETSLEPEQLALAADPNGYLAANNIRLLVHSPSLTSGVSFELPYFSHAFGFATGQSIQPSDFAQSLDRVRQAIPRIVYSVACGRSSNPSLARNPIEYSGDLYRKARAVAGVLKEPGLISQLDVSSPAAFYHAVTKAKENSSMAMFGMELQTRLQQEGKEVILWDPASLSDEQQVEIQEALSLWQVAQSTVKHAKAAAIVAAPIICPDEADHLEKQRVLSVADRHKLQRFHVANFDPRLRPEDLTVDQVLSRLEDHYYRRIRRLEHCLIGGLTESRDQDKLRALRAFLRPVPMHDLPTATLQKQLAEQSPITGFLHWAIVRSRSGESWTNSTPEIIDLAEWLKAHRPEAECLGLRVNENQSPCAIAGMVLNHFALRTISKRDTSGNRTRHYSLDLDALEELSALLEARAQRHLANGLTLVQSPLTEALLGGLAKKLQRQGQRQPAQGFGRPSLQKRPPSRRPK
ncbi:plasmid replication protein, CyRepA1 family (plasmid) [Synechococcus elongatus IITB7]|uniref:plasmid replication protein, CyRepA1 family n=1 Tax=Synechococcus elongatus TaxID=32046 RepID=UPI0030CA650B